MINIFTFEEFKTYFDYCTGLQFEERPDYKMLRNLFKNVFDRYNYEMDFKYDWNLILENVLFYF